MGPRRSNRELQLLRKVLAGRPDNHNLATVLLLAPIRLFAIFCSVALFDTIETFALVLFHEKVGAIANAVGATANATLRFSLANARRHGYSGLKMGLRPRLKPVAATWALEWRTCSKSSLPRRQ